MKRFSGLSTLSVAAIIVFLAVIPGSGSALAQLPESAFVPDEILIGIRPDVAASLEPSKRLKSLGTASLDDLCARFRVRDIVRVFPEVSDKDRFAEQNGLSGIFKLTVPSGTDIFSMIEEYAKDPSIEYAEPNRIYEAMKVPSDTGFKKQWGLHNTGQSRGLKDADIDAPEAWDLEQGEASVVIAVIDTGVDYKHPDLGGGRVLTDNDRDFINNDSDAMDDHGHGTYVAGIVGANSNNKLGVTGVCWGCRILPVKVLNSEGKGSADAVAQGIEYAANQGAQILSMSLGFTAGCGCSKTIARAINYAYERGSLLIAAAGNDSDKDTTGYPASSPRVLAVGASDRTDKEADFSNRDRQLDIVAPGKDIYSLNLSTASKKYETGSGTSAATPFVSGTAGLILSMRPDLRNSQVWRTLLDSRDNLPRPLPGRLNARKALEKITTQSFTAAQDDCSGEPTNCPVGCAAEVTLTGARGFAQAIAVLHDLRDRVLAPTPLGAEWVELYERHRLEVALILLTDEDLRTRTREALVGWLPLLRAATQGSKTPVHLTANQIQGAREIISTLMDRGSDGLREDLASALAVLNERILVPGKDHREMLKELRAPR